MISSEREVPATVLDADISEVGEHVSTVEVGLGNEPDSSAKVMMSQKLIEFFSPFF